ncbi:MAG: hypothetical protein JWN70_5397 [Planctomycetaceae bacterium]|nr:hypothetical protein [Planctomycetaceae bacterium]
MLSTAGDVIGSRTGGANLFGRKLTWNCGQGLVKSARAAQLEAATGLTRYASKRIPTLLDIRQSVSRTSPWRKIFHN